jgi:hypothetical protein
MYRKNIYPRSMSRWSSSGALTQADSQLAFALAKELEYPNSLFGHFAQVQDRPIVCLTPLINPEKQVLNTWPYGKPINFNFISSSKLLYVMDFKSGPTVKWNDITAAPNFKASESTN